MGKTTTLNKQDANVFYTGSWSGLTGITTKEIENISNENYGFGSFGDYIQLSDDTDTFVAGTDYNYDERLDDVSDGVDIYDDEISGAFTIDKHVRVVENSKNITDVAHTSGGLKVYAKNLTTIISPPSDKIYVDPYRGKVVLPRPDFFSKCKGTNGWLSPEICDPNDSAPTITNVVESGGYFTVLTTGGKFNDDGAIVAVHSTAGHYGQGSVNPFGEDTCPDKGILSCWLTRAGNSLGLIQHITFYIGKTDTYVQFYYNRNGAVNYIRIYVNGSQVDTDSTIWWATLPNLHHCYIIWDKDGGLSGSKSIKVLFNGVELLSTATTWALNSKLRIHSYSTQEVLFTGWGGTYLDHIQIWKSIIEESSTWLYNGGAGRENALHIIYGSANDYAPTGLKVGYKYVTPSTNPVVLAEADASGAKAEWNII